MELKEFIAQTIIQITDGISAGNTYLQSTEKKGDINNGYMRVNFDVAVSTSDESKNDKGGKITIVNIFQAGVNKENNSKNSYESRIQFNILMIVNTK